MGRSNSSSGSSWMWIYRKDPLKFLYTAHQSVPTELKYIDRRPVPPTNFEGMLSFTLYIMHQAFCPSSGQIGQINEHKEVTSDPHQSSPNRRICVVHVVGFSQSSMLTNILTNLRVDLSDTAPTPFHITSSWIMICATILIYSMR